MVATTSYGGWHSWVLFFLTGWVDNRLIFMLWLFACVQQCLVTRSRGKDCCVFKVK